jgi:hypothetical protein
MIYAYGEPPFMLTVIACLTYFTHRSQTSWIWLETKLVELGMLGSDRNYKVPTIITWGSMNISQLGRQISFGDNLDRILHQ